MLLSIVEINCFARNQDFSYKLRLDKDRLLSDHLEEDSELNKIVIGRLY